MSTLILSDFSKTFTDGDMPTTYSVFAKSGLLGSEYTAARNALFDERYHFETEGNAAETQRWFYDHVELFVQFGLTQALIDQIVADDTYFKPRAGIAAFLAHIRENHITLRIITSGVSNFAEAFFRVRGFGLEGIDIQGNRLIMENGRAVGVDRSSGINTIDKSDHAFSLSGYDRIIVLGDNYEDCTVAHGVNVRSFGFTDEDRGFDVKLGKNGSFEDLLKQI